MFTAISATKSNENKPSSLFHVSILPNLFVPTECILTLFVYFCRTRKNLLEHKKETYNRFMRIVIQRVTHASVTIGGKVKSAIGQGYLILLGICEEDTSEDVEWLVKKQPDYESLKTRTES